MKALTSKGRVVILAALVLLTPLVIWAILRVTRQTTPRTPAGARPITVASFASRAIGDRAEGTPWIADLAMIDLDRDGLVDVLVADAQRNRVTWIRQSSPGVFIEQTIGEGVAAPAHVTAADMNGDSHLDVLVASMGVIPPNNDPLGAVVLLENDGTQTFAQRTLLQNVSRVSFVEAADLNKDGRLDLVVGQFGYLQGQLCWLENQGGWRFKSHPLSDLPGTIHAPVVDLNGDGQLDVVALVSQDVEEVQAFMGDGKGGFRARVLHGSTNKDYGSSGLCIADVNQDGRPDIVFTNGDGFDYATPGSRPWHGVQWLENRDGESFRYHRVAEIAGSYSPVVVDLEGDGDMDIVVSSAFNDWTRAESASLYCLENNGAQGFTPRILAHRPTHLVVVAAGPLAPGGRTALVAGAFLFYPPYKSISRVTLWEPAR